MKRLFQHIFLYIFLSRGLCLCQFLCLLALNHMGLHRNESKYCEKYLCSVNTEQSIQKRIVSQRKM